MCSLYYSNILGLHLWQNVNTHTLCFIPNGIFIAMNKYYVFKNTHSWLQHEEILAALPKRVRGLSPVFFQTCQHVFFLCACSILSGLGPQLLISEHVQGGPLLIKRPRLNASGSPGHCPINQIVNVIRRMWDVAATGQMKHAEEGLLSCRLGSSGR